MEIMKRMWRHWKIELNLLTCVVLLVTGVSSSLAEEDLTLQVNTRKPLSVCSDKFLSLVIDPLATFTSEDVTEDYERSIKLARALSPAYLRLGGPRSNTYLLGNHNDTSYVFSEKNWARLHRWASRTELDVVACISTRFMENDNKVDLVSLTDRMGFNTSWQLGYECQTRCDSTGSDVGKYVRILRDKLNTIPRYSNSIIIGPDVVAYGTKEQREYLENFFREADDALTAVTWHPDFASVTRNDRDIFMYHDRLLSERNDLYGIIGHEIAKKPLWIAESRPETSKNQFLGALVWAKRLGNAAKLGIQVLMRQPSDLAKPTPDYWVSLLHKNLVGREVFDARIQTGNTSHVHFYVQCTKASEIYEKGALTIFGVNLTPTKIRANVKGLKLRTLHEYVLLPGFEASNRMFAESVLLNGKPLNLINDTELPDMEAVTLNDEKGLSVELPPGGIGFWVAPDQKIRSCMNHYDGKEEEEADLEGDLISQKTSRRGEKEREDNEIRRKRRLIDHQKFIARQEGRKRKNIEKREGDDGERKLRKIDAQKELEKLGKILKRRYARRESKKTTSTGESLDLFDFDTAKGTNSDEMKEENTEKKSKRDLDKFLEDSSRTDRKHKRRDETRRNEQSWMILDSKKGDSSENNFYGFFRQEPMKNFPEGDVFLATGDSKEQEEKDYDYVKDEDDVKNVEEEEKLKLPQAMKIRTIDYTEPDDTWVEVGNDYQGYMPNEFYETINVPNIGERKVPVNDYADIWEAETIQKHSVTKENNEKDATESKSTQESGSSIVEERRIKGNSVNMLMNHYANTPLGKGNHEDLEESHRGRAPGSRDFTVASPPDKTKLTLHSKRRAKTVPLEDDELFFKSIGTSTPMQIPNYGDFSKYGKRLKREVEDLNTLLEQEMINEDNGNSKDCRCRVIRKLNENPGFDFSRIKRSVNGNEEENVELMDKNYEIDQSMDLVEENFNPDNDIVDETPITISEINESSHDHQGIQESNDSKTSSEFMTNEDQFFRRQHEQPEETTTTIDSNEDHNWDTSQIPQDTTPTPEKNHSTTIPNIVVPEKTETIKISSLENSETSSRDKKETTKVLTNIESTESKAALKREVSNSKITKRIENDRPSKSVRSPKETSKGSKKLLSKSANSSKTKIQSNPKASEAARSFDSHLTSRNEALSALKKESEERRKNVVGSISNEKHRDHRQERTEKLESLRRRLLAKREEILKQYEDELLEAMRRNDINEEEKRRRNKNRRNWKREIWEKLRSTDEYRDMLNREKVAYVLTYGPINYDLVETEKEKPVREEKKYIPIVEITRPIYRVEEKLIDEPTEKAHRHLQDPRVMLYAKSDGSNSRMIQSRFPYDIIGERERYGSLDQVASGKRYYALVDSSEEDPWMFQYQRRSKESQRNAYESGEKKEKQLDESIRTYGTPIRYIYENSEETIDSDEFSNAESTKRKIYAIDPATYKGGEPELEIHQDSSESSVNNGDDSDTTPAKEVYSVILKPQSGGTANVLSDDQAQKNAPIFYVLDAKRQNDPKKQSNVLTYLLDRRHVNDNTERKSDIEDNSTTTEHDVIESMETPEAKINDTTEIGTDLKETLENIEDTSKIDSNEEKENAKNHRTRRAIEETNAGLLKQMPLVFISETPYEDRSTRNAEQFSKLLKRLDALESVQYNTKKNIPITFDKFFSSSDQFDDDLSNIILLPKTKDLSKNSKQNLYDDNQQEDVSSTNEREDDKSRKTMSDKIKGNEKFNVNQSGRRWLKLLPVTMEKFKRERRQLEDSLNWNDNELRSLHPNEILRTTSKISKNPKITSKQVYTYVKENGGNIWNNLDDFNKARKISNDLWLFKPLSIRKEEQNYENNILEDPPQPNSVIKTNDRKDGTESNNKSSSFLQGALPKLQDVIIEGFDKAQNLTESLEQFVESFDKKFNETLQMGDNKNRTLNKNTISSTTNDIFRKSITNVKKFFAFLNGITHIFYV